MPLKVSSQGWVKVAPPPKPAGRRRHVDPEEQKEALCHPLRYFACQVTDPSRERLRMLGGRAGFSSSQVDLLRPHSRLEKSSTLDEWRFDVPPSRSSSRQSGNVFGASSPPRDVQHDGGSLNNSSSRKKENNNENQQSDRNGVRPARDRRRDRIASAPVVIPVSPPQSTYDEMESHAEDIVEVEVYPDNASESASERYCRHKHLHNKPRKAPTVIPEEEEPAPIPSPTTGTAGSEILRLRRAENDAHIPTSVPLSAPAQAKSEIFSSGGIEDEAPFPVPKPTPAPSIARSDTYRSQRTEIDLPIPSAIPEESVPAPIPVSISRSTRAKSERSVRSERSDGSSRSSQSSGSSRSSTTYRSRRNESDSESSYAPSTRSASPVRDRHDKYHRTDRFDDDTSSFYPSPPSSPPPIARRTRGDLRSSEDASRTYRDRATTAPVSNLRPPPALSSSTWSSKSSSLSSRSSAPSIDGYQFQAAIFQPKSNYRGYRAPSLSKGNRWETATSALSFD